MQRRRGFTKTKRAPLRGRTHAMSAQKCPHTRTPKSVHNLLVDSGYKWEGLKDNIVVFLLTSNVNEPRFREGGQLGRGRGAREDLGN